jgi:hypothetical protein
MDFNTKFPFSSVYKIAKHGLSLYTQEYMQKYLDESDKEKTKEIEDKKEVFPKKSEINLEPKDELGNNQV